MRALTITPGQANSLAVTDVADVTQSDDRLLVQGLLMGVCGTDHELNGGKYGWAPPGRSELIIGHESLGRVVAAPADSGFSEGDLIAGVVRRPDPVPCMACGHGAFDMCRNGQYTERGIKELDGFGSQMWDIEPAYAVPVRADVGESGVLIEPTSVVAKAWAEIEAVGERSWFAPQSVVISGAGPVGLLAALLGTQRELDVHVVDVVTDGPKPELVARLGATYHSDEFENVLREVRPDVVIDTTGLSALLAAAMRELTPYRITCLLGMHDAQRKTGIDLATWGKTTVLDNGVVVGSVNANVQHWQQAADALAAADPDWLRSLITRRVPLRSALEAFQRADGDVKVVIDLQD
ncbi:alcohol dehydrogenase catalytic domain-containing protein [Epidermidibacterium keratini]|uniref:Alcohol dehydrogenase catalytic domain-containing protein n=1 Tax=Epidermidibacterium keratini TaxID=1891644 RepID=A0A7L4YMM4_9ACTN|nr:alcohol dehydrogenase catalytic domain-containing protein [Epidermidibacterium keratini]QHC00338.1 alcohol dehydrogenase catalytic domain-containing protein [Epidermidibacterium keratini]